MVVSAGHGRPARLAVVTCRGRKEKYRAHEEPGCPQSEPPVHHRPVEARSGTQDTGFQQDVLRSGEHRPEG